MRPGSFASVCGIYPIDLVQQVERFGLPMGTIIYLVEFSDGEALEVPEKWVELIVDPRAGNVSEQ